MGALSAAHAAKPTTWIVIDASNGEIVNQHDPDALNYPASLTKMMTLFLTFDALEHHQISLQTQFTVSRHASAQQPSKLGLVPDSTISVHDLILAVVTHSANDAAVVLAEGLAGSEAAFAVRMNREARALGMTRTNFRNASGLPNPFQYTTARDLSKLAMGLYRTFPREYSYFATESFTYRGETYGNHNHLMEAFQGMDGIKTGFINASGFNLAASAVRNNRRLIGVIMGGRTAESRDMEMAELLDDGFAHRGLGTVAPIAVAAAERPAPAPVAAAPVAAPIRAPAPAVVAVSEPPPPGTLHLRNGDSESVIASNLPPVAPDPIAEEIAAEPEHDQPVYRAASVHERRSHRHPRVAHHPALRHGVELAAATEEAAPVRHSRHAAATSRHHRPAHRYAGANRHQHLAAARHRPAAPSHRYAALHHRNHAVRSVSATKTIGQHHHGLACGGWNGNNQPCPPSLRSPIRHDTMRSASRTHGPTAPTS